MGSAWADRNGWPRKFADEWKTFCEAMIPFYKDMRYVDQEEIIGLTDRGFPLTRPLRDRRGDLDSSLVG